MPRPPYDSVSHKTIIMLDHSSNFDKMCEHQSFEFHRTKSKGSSKKVAKTLWESSVEAATEYCRTAWELFPEGKLIRFLLFDSRGYLLNSWNSSEQNLSFILNQLIIVDKPAEENVNDEQHPIFFGIQAAIQAMWEHSAEQFQSRFSTNNYSPCSVINKNRIVCITSVEDISTINDFKESFQEEINNANEVATSSDLMIPIDYCELVIVNIQSTPGDKIEKHKVSPLLECEVHNIKSSQLNCKLLSIILKHYNLVSTTIKGIPMKEEQNTKLLKNYDVEIFHPARAHRELFKHYAFDLKNTYVQKEGFDYSTVTLTWRTIRSNTATEMQSYNISSEHRITPVLVKSRPSSCLVNFLYGGKIAALEVVRKNGSKLSHFLTAKSRQIYLHSIAFGKSVQQEVSSCSEDDLDNYIDRNTFSCCKSETLNNIETANKQRLKRFWCHVKFSSAVLQHFKQHLEPILNHVIQSELNDEEVYHCKKCIFDLFEQLETASHEKENFESLNKSQLWIQLESFLTANCLTESHKAVLDCLLEVLNKDSIPKPASRLELEAPTQQERISLKRKSVLELWLTKNHRMTRRMELEGISKAQRLPNGILKFNLYQSMRETTLLKYRKNAAI